MAVADALNYVVESDEGNNGLAGNVLNLDKNLTMTLVSSTQPDANRQVTVSLRTVNTGPVPTKAFFVRVYLSVDETITTSDTYLGQWYVSPGLNGQGATASNDLLLTISAAVGTGDYYVGAIADALNYVAETDEGDNPLTGNVITVP